MQTWLWLFGVQRYGPSSQISSVQAWSLWQPPGGSCKFCMWPVLREPAQPCSASGAISSGFPAIPLFQTWNDRLHKTKKIQQRGRDARHRKNNIASLHLQPPCLTRLSRFLPVLCSYFGRGRARPWARICCLTLVPQFSTRGTSLQLFLSSLAQLVEKGPYSTRDLEASRWNAPAFTHQLPKQ